MIRVFAQWTPSEQARAVELFNQVDATKKWLDAAVATFEASLTSIPGRVREEARERVIACTEQWLDAKESCEDFVRRTTYGR